MEQFKQKFIDDALDLVIDLEKQLLKLSEDLSNKDITQEVFRVMHTIKGTAGMYGFDNVGELTHHLENIYDDIRNDMLKMEPHIISLTLRGVDCLKFLLHNDDQQIGECATDFVKIKSDILKISDSDQQAQAFQDTNTDSFEKQSLFYIRIRPDLQTFKRGMNPLNAFTELSEIGQLVSRVFVDDVPVINKINPQECYVWWEILFKTSESLSEVEDVFMFFMEDEFNVLEISEIPIGADTDFVNSYKELFPDLSLDEISKHLGELNSLLDTPDMLIEKPSENKMPVEVDKTENQESDKKNIDAIKEHIKIQSSTSSIRVSSEKLDELMNLVSELVTTRARLSLIDEKRDYESLTEVVENLTKLSKQFRDNVLEIRLVPVETLMTRLKRLVYDLSDELGREVDFVIEGADTELDKTIINSLESPLMHIIRNSIDHGIESPEERAKSGKERRGIVRFIAFYSGSNVFIQIQDDGRGIDPVVIRQQAIKKGMLTNDVSLSKKELYNLIFLPGFSTARRITGISGRGVGMDVVRQEISNLRGEIEIDSEVKLGTSVTLKLPLTLSIIDTLLVKVGASYFLIPLSVIDICELAEHAELFKNANRRFEYQDDLIPFIALREVFEIPGAPPKEERLIIIKNNEKRYALLVDTVEGEHQAVIKPLGEMFVNQEYLAGASILGDGSLALIIDSQKLIKALR